MNLTQNLMQSTHAGAPGMMKYINQTFHDHPRAYLSLESRMACGMGACYACVLKVPDSDTVSQTCCVKMGLYLKQELLFYRRVS